ncbi:hypothetical protein MUK42_15345, partial [Musa troglodytarum]
HSKPVGSSAFSDRYACGGRSKTLGLGDPVGFRLRSTANLSLLWLVSQNIRGGRLRAFASPGLRVRAAQLLLPWMSEIHPHVDILLPVDDDNFKACFSKHSQWPPESFRLARLESLCCSILPWMSET